MLQIVKELTDVAAVTVIENTVTLKLTVDKRTVVSYSLYLFGSDSVWLPVNELAFEDHTTFGSQLAVATWLIIFEKSFYNHACL